MGWLKGFIIAAAVTLAWPASAQTQAQGTVCRDPAKPMLRAELYFGRNIGGRLGVSERQWAQFLKREITPRFPDGLTVIDAKGQWRNPATGSILREPSKIVIVVTADEPAAHQRLAAAALAYQQRFKQKSVGVVTRAVCAAFAP